MFQKIFGWAILLTALPLSYFVIKKHLEVARAVKYEGTVVGLVPVPGGRGGVLYSLDIIYRDKNGVNIRFISRYAANPSPRNVGDRVTVLDQGDTSTPDVLIFRNLYLWQWFWACVLIFTAGCFLGA